MEIYEILPLAIIILAMVVANLLIVTSNIKPYKGIFFLIVIFFILILILGVWLHWTMINDYDRCMTDLAGTIWQESCAGRKPPSWFGW